MFFGERERERERNIDWLPPVCAPTRDWTCNLSVYRTTLQPTDPLSQGSLGILYWFVLDFIWLKKCSVELGEGKWETEWIFPLALTPHPFPRLVEVWGLHFLVKAVLQCSSVEGFPGFPMTLRSCSAESPSISLQRAKAGGPVTHAQSPSCSPFSSNVLWIHCDL